MNSIASQQLTLGPTITPRGSWWIRRLLIILVADKRGLRDVQKEEVFLLFPGNTCTHVLKNICLPKIPKSKVHCLTQGVLPAWYPAGRKPNLLQPGWSLLVLRALRPYRPNKLIWTYCRADTSWHFGFYKVICRFISEITTQLQTARYCTTTNRKRSWMSAALHFVSLIRVSHHLHTPVRHNLVNLLTVLLSKGREDVEITMTTRMMKDGSSTMTLRPNNTS